MTHSTKVIVQVALPCGCKVERSMYSGGGVSELDAVIRQSGNVLPPWLKLMAERHICPEALKNVA